MLFTRLRLQLYLISNLKPFPLKTTTFEIQSSKSPDFEWLVLDSHCIQMVPLNKSYQIQHGDPNMGLVQYSNGKSESPMLIFQLAIQIPDYLFLNSGPFEHQMFLNFVSRYNLQSNIRLTDHFERLQNYSSTAQFV